MGPLHRRSRTSTRDLYELTARARGRGPSGLPRTERSVPRRSAGPTISIGSRILAGSIEISATITEATAHALENAKDLPEEVSNVAQRDIAGAGFEHLSPTVAYRFVEVIELS
jgi:hypothetical protein